MQEGVKRLIEFGVPPEDYTEDNDNFPDTWLKEYTEILQSIKQPITWEEASIIIKHAPYGPLYEVEWTLLHRFESVLEYDNPKFKVGDPLPQQYIDLVNTCNSDYMKRMLLERCRK